MLFHVTITHRQEDCPGRRPEETPPFIGPADRLAELGNELSVTPHIVVWGASCILWAEPEHVAYAVLEAASLEAVQRYIDALAPAGWTTRALPVFSLPTQLATVRQLLAVPAIPFVQPPALVTEPPDDRDTADTLEGLMVGVTEPDGDQPTPIGGAPPIDSNPPAVPPDEPPDNQVTRAMPQPAGVLPAAPEPVAPPDRRPVPDSGAVTRIVERPAILEGLGSSPPRPDQSEPPLVPEAANEPDSVSESSTVILEPPAPHVAGMRLVASTGPAQGSVFDVGESGATLGRLPENSICFVDGRLSRHHARIEFRDGGYWLSDLASQNGTLINDRALTEAHRLQAGDSIELGTTRLTVVLDPED